MGTNVTVKGQVTLPKAVRDAAGIRPGDRVSVRLRPEGGVIIERAALGPDQKNYLAQLDDIAHRRPFREGPFGAKTTEEIMRELRGDD